MSDKIHLAEVAPPACASCNGQYIERRHIDFGAAFDGPTLPPDSDKVAGGKYLSVDDLVICEECVSAAAALLNLVDGERLQAQIRELEEMANGLGQRLRAVTEHAASLEQAEENRRKVVELFG